MSNYGFCHFKVVFFSRISLVVISYLMKTGMKRHVWQLRLQVTSKASDGGASIRENWPSFLHSGRKWRHIVHLYPESIVSSPGASFVCSSDDKWGRKLTFPQQTHKFDELLDAIKGSGKRAQKTVLFVMKPIIKTFKYWLEKWAS